LITPSKELKQYLRLFKTKGDACEKIGIDEATLSKIMKEDYNVSSTVIAKILNASGFDFDTAFEVKE
jgi:hypothetical protein